MTRNGIFRFICNFIMCMSDLLPLSVCGTLLGPEGGGRVTAQGFGVVVGGMDAATAAAATSNIGTT